LLILVFTSCSTRLSGRKTKRALYEHPKM
jgi:hypothetical protein